MFLYLQYRSHTRRAYTFNRSVAGPPDVVDGVIFCCCSFFLFRQLPLGSPNGTQPDYATCWEVSHIYKICPISSPDNRGPEKLHIFDGFRQVSYFDNFATRSRRVSNETWTAALESTKTSSAVSKFTNFGLQTAKKKTLNLPTLSISTFCLLPAFVHVVIEGD